MARTEALRNYVSLEDKEALPTYDAGFDIQAYTALNKLQNTPDFFKKKTSLDNYVSTQMKTHLAERLNAIMTTTKYTINNGELYGQGMDEPFTATIKRGIKYSRFNGGKDVDFPREEAELAGFLKIQSILADPKTEVGTTIISISPKANNSSSRYTHNFYDVFSLEEKNGERIVQMRRYSSALGALESSQRVSHLSNEPMPLPTAESLLANPIIIDIKGVSADDIHQLLHEDHQFLSEKEFNKISLACEPMIVEYINALSTSPFDEAKLKDAYDAVINNADELRGKGEFDLQLLMQQYKNPFFLTQEIKRLGALQVKKVMTGCGSSGGYTNSLSSIMSESSIFSVADLGEQDYEFNQQGPCRICGNDVPCGPCKICQSCDAKIRANETTYAE